MPPYEQLTLQEFFRIKTSAGYKESAGWLSAVKNVATAPFRGAKKLGKATALTGLVGLTGAGVAGYGMMNYAKNRGIQGTPTSPQFAATPQQQQLLQTYR